MGLDVSASSIKLVELSKDRAGEFTLERCAIEPLERGWINEGNFEKFDEVVEAARRLIKKSGTKAKHVAMALPASVVISKKIILPGGLVSARWRPRSRWRPASTSPSPWTRSALIFA